MKIKSKRRAVAFIGTAAVAAMVLASCGSSTSSTPSSSNVKVAGGTAYFAEGAGANPNYIFPMDSSSYFSVSNIDQFQYLMYRPLYWYGDGTKAQIDYSLSIGNKPVFSNGGKTVTVTLKNYKWSNGESVDASDVIFWMNVLKAALANNASDWGGYVPGAFPDNVVSYTAPNSHTVVFQLNKAYNPTWFTYNELSQITPLPMAWDRTSLTAPAPTSTTANVPSDTPSGALAVYNFLNTQSTSLATYATSPIWSVVDGPWKLQSFTTEGKAVFVPNPSYSGPVKPTLSKFVELPFTSDTAEFDVVASGNGAITYGYLPITDLPQLSRVEGDGYVMKPWIDLGFNYFVENYNNPTYGPLFKQLYFRQAFQHLVDQPAYIKDFDKGYAVPSYSPVPQEPTNPFIDAQSKTNPYPYSLSAAKNLLESHGWKVVNGVMTCEKPGSTATECGTGVPMGQTLTFNLQYASGATALTEQMQALASAAKQDDITINLSQASFDTVIGNAAPCTPSQASCKWQMENWGGGWEYSPDNEPTGGELFSVGAGSNFGSYDSSEMNKLISATHTSSNTTAAMDAYQNYAVTQLPVIYQPAADYALSLIAKNLHGVVQGPYLDLNPEDWYFTK